MREDISPHPKWFSVFVPIIVFSLQLLFTRQRGNLKRII
jgi:hypothetical protein